MTEDRLEGELVVPRKVTAKIDEQVLVHIRSSPGGMGIEALSCFATKSADDHFKDVYRN